MICWSDGFLNYPPGFWFYFRMTDKENYNDWDKYEEINIQKLMRLDKLKRLT